MVAKNKFKRFPRPCKRCGGKFIPSGRYAQFCDNCKKQGGKRKYGNEEK